MAATPPLTTPARQLFTEAATDQAWWFLDSMVVLRDPEGAPRIPVVMELVVRLLSGSW
jgi:hypothetical protein